MGSLRRVSVFKQAIASGRLAAFNVVDLAMAQGAIRAAAASGVCAIIQFSTRTVRHFGASTLSNAVKSMAARWRTQVFVHLDHCADEEVLWDAINGGFDGIMADGSHLDLEDNVRFTRTWVQRAHAAGVVAEGEFGAIGGVEEDVAGGPDGVRVEADAVIDFAIRTGVDLIGTNIGTAHGVYSAPPAIDFDLIERVVPGLPAGLVVHGGSGLSAETLRRLSRLGVAKVNFSTDLKLAWAAGMRTILDREANPEPLACARAAEEAVLDVCRAKIEALRD